MSATSEWERARRTGGERKLHPDTEKSFGITWGSKLWDSSKGILGGALSLIWTGLKIAAIILITFGIGLKLYSEGGISLPKQEPTPIETVNVVQEPIIRYVDRERIVVKWRTPPTRYRTNPVNKELAVANRILREKAAGLEARLASFDKNCSLMKKIIDDFYDKPLKKGYVRRLYYKSGNSALNSSDSDFIPIDKLP